MLGTLVAVGQAQALQLEGLGREAVQRRRGGVDLWPVRAAGDGEVDGCWQLVGQVPVGQSGVQANRRLRNACGEGGELGVHRRVAVDGLHDAAGEHLQRPLVAKSVERVARDAGVYGLTDAERPLAKALLDRCQV